MSWNLETLALFAHIVGALLLFLGIGLLWISALRLRSVRTVAQAREWSGLSRAVGRMGPISGALILLPGVYMTVTLWGGAPWILVSLGAMLVVMAPGMIVSGRGMGAIHKSLAAGADEDVISPEALRQIEHPALWRAIQVWAAAGLGVVFLMTTKPGWAGSLVVIGVSLALGLAVGILSSPRRALAMISASMRGASVR